MRVEIGSLVRDIFLILQDEFAECLFRDGCFSPTFLAAEFINGLKEGDGNANVEKDFIFFGSLRCAFHCADCKAT